MDDRAEESIGEMPTLGHEETVRAMHSPAWNQDESIGEIPTLGPGGIVDKGRKDSVRAQQEPVWNPDESIGKLTTLKPEGIVDDGRTDGARRWKAGEEILGRYVVERELGQGGMGVVYGCFDKVGGVRVAVKCLPPELSHNSVEMEEVRENFELVVGLRHPNIAGVRTLEKDGRGEYYLVMDVAEGENLRAWLRRKWKAGGVSLDEAVGVLGQVASALDYAHGEKVVHRDVKPGNVMIDGRGRVKVLDFGLAAQIRTSLSRASHVYQGTSGTGPYMAPEQWEGQPQDGAADQYALGVMAYEMLAGRLPFENSELAVLKDAVLHGTVRDIPGLAKQAMGALRRALAKRAEERWESCGAFVDALGGKRTGGGGHRSARGKTLAGWVMVLGLAVAVAVASGVWWRESRKGAVRLERGGNAVEETARPEGSPHQQEAAQVETEQKAEEERLAAEKAEKEKRLAEQKAAEEARLAEEREAAEEAKRQEEARVKAQREEEIRRKSEELEETIYRLAPLAKTKVENIERMGYDRGQGFGAKLDEMRTNLGQGNTAVSARDFEKAKEYFDTAMAAAAWCEENAPLREAAARARAATAAAKEKADAMDGAHLALRSYRQGNEQAEKAGMAFGGARFKDAAEVWNEAGKAYALAETEARSEKVRQGLEVAKGGNLRGAWEEVIAAAEEVLALEAGNAEAQRLKKMAEGQMKPSILLKATLNGREVEATVTTGLVQSGLKTPVTVNLETGGDYSFTAEYEEGGKKYTGQEIVQAKKQGMTEAELVLKEVKKAAAEDVFALDLGNGVKLEIVHCPGVSADFWMGKYEVTQEQWKQVMGKNPSHFGNKPKNPVENVTWNDCQDFVRKLNALPEMRAISLTFRLPTPEEWETACRAGAPKSADYCKLADGTQITAATLGKVARYGQAWFVGPVAVGSFLPNAWGLYDMHGNVWEWVQAAGHFRGGSFLNSAGSCTAGYKDLAAPVYSRRSLGLRLAASGRVARR